jgi:DNA repair exonuclease SbcCD nuclease subunit
MSDLHLGVSYKSLRGRDVRGYVNNNILSNIEYAFSYAVDNSVDLVLISGDIFNRLYLSFYYASKLASKLKVLYENGIPVVIVAGNHDAPKVRGIHSPLAMFSEVGLDNIYYFEGLREKPLELSVDGHLIGLIPLPYIHISDISTASPKISRYIRDQYELIKDKDI